MNSKRLEKIKNAYLKLKALDTGKLFMGVSIHHFEKSEFDMNEWYDASFTNENNRKICYMILKSEKNKPFHLVVFFNN